MATLRETIHSTHPQVDASAGVIRGVKVLGRNSKNGRTYSERALRDAAKLYERLDVNLDHPPRERAGMERSVKDMFGWLESVRVRNDGVYADLHYTQSHPMAAAIAEIAQRNPSRIGLSHNAEGTVVARNGRDVVESIERVRSVDLVQNPATTRGLFEAAGGVRLTRRQVLEAYAGRKTPMLPGMEEPMEGPEELPDEMAGDADGSPEVDEQDGAKQALTQVFSAALKGGGDLKDVLTKVIDLAAAMLGALPGAETETDPEMEQMPGDKEAEGDASEPGEEDEPYLDPRDAKSAKTRKSMPESARTSTIAQLQESIRALGNRLHRQEARTRAVGLLEGANREVTELRVNALMAATTPRARKSLIESWAEKPRDYRSRSGASRVSQDSDVRPYPQTNPFLKAGQ